MKTTVSNIRSMRAIPLFAALTSLILFTAACGRGGAGSIGEAGTAAVTDSIYISVDSLPVFQGGDQALLEYISRNTTYPEEAKTKNISGRVIVRFAVRTDGSVYNVTLERGVDPLLDKEALKVVSSLPAFEKPGYLKGVAVPVWYVVPITFALK